MTIDSEFDKVVDQSSSFDFGKDEFETEEPVSTGSGEELIMRQSWECW